MAKAQKQGLKYEKAKAKSMRLKHVGGPGKEDARKGKRKYEMKKWKTKIHVGVLKKALKKGIKTIIAPGGFTEPAKKLAREKKITLKR